MRVSPTALARSVLGLGKHLYVPMSAVQEVLTESVFLARRKEDFESLGYYEKPPQLP
jgi:hypothetical protein